jgi:hypothetical protein
MRLGGSYDDQGFAMLINTPVAQVLGNFKFTQVLAETIQLMVPRAGHYLVEHRGSGLCAVHFSSNVRLGLTNAFGGTVSNYLRDEHPFNVNDYFFYVGTPIKKGGRLTADDKYAITEALGIKSAGPHNRVNKPDSTYEIHMLTHRKTGLFFLSESVSGTFKPMVTIAYMNAYRERRHKLNNLPLRNFVEKCWIENQQPLHPEEFDHRVLDSNIKSKADAIELKRKYAFTHGTDKCLSTGLGQKQWELYAIAKGELDARART